MRNLAEYPVTFEEVTEFLTELRDSFMSEEKCGDMRPLLVDWALERLYQYEDLRNS